MKNNDKIMQHANTLWPRLKAFLVCVLAVICLTCTSVAVIAETAPQDPREQLKSRLMYQIEYEGWDPYSSDMTVEEFFALMELFDDGRLPLNQAGKKRKAAAIASPSNDATVPHIPRTMFLFEGLPSDNVATDITAQEEYYPENADKLLPYKNANNYEMYDPNPDEGIYKAIWIEGEIFTIGVAEYVTLQYWTMESEGGEFIDTGMKFIRMEIIDEGGDREVLWSIDNQDKEPGEELVYWEVAERLAINYPAGLDEYHNGYVRPSKNWEGVELDKKSLKVVIVDENKNADNRSVSGNINQDLFYYYPGYYVRRVSIGGIDNTVLGMIRVPQYATDAEGKPTTEIVGYKEVYYYLSAEDQNDKVSTTTMSEGQKFIVEYTPNEHTVDYVVAMNGDVADADGWKTVMDNTVSTVDGKTVYQNYVTPAAAAAKFSIESLFGSYRPAKTTGGAYAFDVTAPYGYKTTVYICIKMDMQLIKDETSGAYSFNVRINHTGKKEDTINDWLKPFYDCLSGNGFLDAGVNENNFKSSKINEEKDDEGNIAWTWKDENDPNADAYNAILERMSQRINSFTLHNDGFPLGAYPDYAVSGDTLLPTANGPATFKWNETFHNNSVKADRIIVAVLEKLDAPKFDVRGVLGGLGGYENTGNGDRGTSASPDWAELSAKPYTGLKGFAGDYYDAEYLYQTAPNHGGIAAEPLAGSAGYPNIKTDDTWSWTNRNQGTQYGSKMQDMKRADDGTYSYIWVFQTNLGNICLLNALSINGVTFSIPFFTKYAWNGYSFSTPSTEDPTVEWQTAGTLPDGATVYLEHLMGFGSNQKFGQNIYRIRVVGAHTDVTVTSMNLVTGNGASEFSVYNLDGIYATRANETDETADQTVGGIQYAKNGEWTWQAKAQIVVTGNISFYTNYLNGFNIRFRVVDGYGEPYYIWKSTKAGIINGNDGNPQTNLQYDENGNIATDAKGAYLYNDVLSVSDLNGATPDSQHIYKDDDGWYYIRVTTQGNYQVALLTIVARTLKYTVRYVPGTIPAGKDVRNDKEYPARTPENMPEFAHIKGTCDPTLLEADKALAIQYDDNNGNYYDLLQNNFASIASNDYGIIRPTDPVRLYEFVDWVMVDENFVPIRLDSKRNAISYDTEQYTLADGTVVTVPVKYKLDEHGNFAHGDDGKLIKIEYTVDENGHIEYKEEGGYKYKEEGTEIRFLSGAIDIAEYSEFAVHRTEFGNAGRDLYVIRIMPTWKKIEHPFYYNVSLNLVNALGEVHTENFSEYVDEVLTEAPVGENDLYVFLNTKSDRLADWIAQYPTYDFWSGVNNSTNEKDVKAALDEYIKDNSITYLMEGNDEYNKDAYESVLKLLNLTDFTGKDSEGNDTSIGTWDPDNYTYSGGGNGKDDFKRLGSDTFAVLEDGGTIVIWMYEVRGGLVFRKDVREEPFVPNDQFYFTVTDAKVGDNQQASLTGTYKAYPEPTVKFDSAGNPGKYIYDETGTSQILDEFNNRIRLISDKDAWLVTFTDGLVTELQKNKSTLYERDENGNVVRDNEGKPIPVNYFTLKDGEGIELYIPAGRYTITELGSKSGYSYKVSVECLDSNGKDIAHGKGWEIPKGNDLWLKGNKKEAFDRTAFPEGVSQVSATVDFVVGAHDVVQTIVFENKTTSLSIEKSLDALEENRAKIPSSYKNAIFKINVKLKLPLANGQRLKPLYDEEEGYYYFNANRYTVTYKEVNGKKQETLKTVGNGMEKLKFEQEGDSDIWVTSFQIKVGERVVLVMHADYDKVNYWVSEDDKPANGGYVYKKNIGTEGQLVYAEYAYYLTKEEAVKAKPNATFVEDPNADISAYKEVIQAATLSGMDLTPLISPSSGTAQVGKKAAVSVVNWFGELPGYGYLKITQVGGDPADNFIFKITSDRTGVSVVISVKGGETAYVYLQSGTYKIEEIGWAWRYDQSNATVTNPADESPEDTQYEGGDEVSVTISLENDSRKKAVHVKYNYDKNYKGWLGGETDENKKFTPATEEQTD